MEKAGLLRPLLCQKTADDRLAEAATIDIGGVNVINPKSSAAVIT